ncbi:alpha/beta fold hydrolase [Corynebacterium sp. 3HC-13]|uniref:alpha/beta fold hydrolase n=1 Tax=Corynebacterium poyangense TaxID=2684405 RepID=UPI00165D2123|nr:alpha/beta hydrolase [Corynebacterium poyangense]MBZ8177552.1 alpha/beta fold hydrolase [Corynebacterium poyangense]
MRLHAATAGSADQPLILLLHGAFGGWFDWRDVISPLADSGYQVAAVDMRGFGYSDHPAGTFGYDLRGAVGDITGVIRSLGHSSATIIGEGSGAAVAWGLAAKSPQLVNNLIAIGAVHPTDFRRHLFSRPWSYRPVPGSLCPTLWRHGSPSEKAYRRNLAACTHPQFHNSYRFEECLQLRVSEIAPSRPKPATRQSLQLLSNSVPNEKYRAAVTSPTVLIHPGGAAWADMEARSRRRVRNRFQAVQIPGTKLLPHLEDPGAFLDATLPALN